MTLAVGEAVVYGAHGAGLIEAREARDVQGEPGVVVVLALSRGLSVQLPLDRAEELLRPVVDEAEITRVQRVLTADAEQSSESWLRRQRDAHAKLGSALGLAEILRDGTDREDGQSPRSNLSPSERELYRRARELLTNEIALSRGVETSEASGWIDDQLSATGAPAGKRRK
jgi:CarD family transcriptional regulator